MKDYAATVTLKQLSGGTELRVLKLEGDGTPVPIGRSSKNSNKNLLTATDNAYFDCPVMSREHAELFVVSSRLSPYRTVMLRDKHSMHGTFVDGKRIKKGDVVALPSASKIKLGDTISRETLLHNGVELKANVVVHTRSAPHVNQKQDSPLAKHTGTFQVPSPSAEDSEVELADAACMDSLLTGDADHDDTPSDDDADSDDLFDEDIPEVHLDKTDAEIESVEVETSGLSQQDAITIEDDERLGHAAEGPASKTAPEDADNELDVASLSGDETFSVYEDDYLGRSSNKEHSVPRESSSPSSSVGPENEQCTGEDASSMELEHKSEAEGTSSHHSDKPEGHEDMSQAELLWKPQAVEMHVEKDASASAANTSRLPPMKTSVEWLSMRSLPALDSSSAELHSEATPLGEPLPSIRTVAPLLDSYGNDTRTMHEANGWYGRDRACGPTQMTPASWGVNYSGGSFLSGYGSSQNARNSDEFMPNFGDTLSEVMRRKDLNQKSVEAQPLACEQRAALTTFEVSEAGEETMASDTVDVTAEAGGDDVSAKTAAEAEAVTHQSRPQYGRQGSERSGATKRKFEVSLLDPVMDMELSHVKGATKRKRGDVEVAEADHGRRTACRTVGQGAAHKRRRHNNQGITKSELAFTAAVSAVGGVMATFGFLWSPLAEKWLA